MAPPRRPPKRPRRSAATACRLLRLPTRPSHGGRFFVDFRARTAASYGHAFLWYGRLKEDGRVGAVEVAGLHPATDSVVPYILGHLIPVPAETGKSYGDLDEQYLTASYRVYLTEAQAKHVFAYIRQKQASSPIWQAGTVNCTGFISDVAGYMGLRTPALPTLMYPENLVKEIKRLNGGRTGNAGLRERLALIPARGSYPARNGRVQNRALWKWPPLQAAISFSGCRLRVPPRPRAAAIPALAR